jgi:hypothetical protein
MIRPYFAIIKILCSKKLTQKNILMFQGSRIGWHIRPHHLGNQCMLTSCTIDQ